MTYTQVQRGYGYSESCLGSTELSSNAWCLRFTIAVMTCLNQKQLGEQRAYLAYTP